MLVKAQENRNNDDSNFILVLKIQAQSSLCIIEVYILGGNIILE